MSRRTLRILVLGLAAACGRGPAATELADGVDRQSFIEVYVSLRQAQQETRSPEAFQRRRQEILRDHGVTEDDLARFIEREGHDIDGMLEVWDEIESRLRAADDAPRP